MRGKNERSLLQNTSFGSEKPKSEKKNGTKLSLSDPKAILRAPIEHFWHFLLIFHVYERKNATSDVNNHLKGMDFNLPALCGNFTLFQEALSIL